MLFEGWCWVAAASCASLSHSCPPVCLLRRLADSVKPYAPGLLGLLPTVWQQAEGQSLLRIQVGLPEGRLGSL